MSPPLIADRLAEALHELKREVDDPELVGYFELVISDRTYRLVEDALRAYGGGRGTRST